MPGLGGFNTAHGSTSILADEPAMAPQMRCSNQLKDEGNRLFSAQRTSEAVEKYQRAKDNLKRAPKAPRHQLCAVWQ